MLQNMSNFHFSTLSVSASTVGQIMKSSGVKKNTFQKRNKVVADGFLIENKSPCLDVNNSSYMEKVSTYSCRQL